MWWLLLVVWPLLGLLGWGWMNYGGYKLYGRSADEESEKFTALKISPLLGPLMIVVAFSAFWEEGVFRFGLRFK